MPDIATTEPSSVAAGDTLQWLKTIPDYPASDGWVLTYHFLGSAGKLTATSTASGDDHLVVVSAFDSSGWSAGDYEWQSRAARGSGAGLEVLTVGRGRLSVLPSFAAATAGSDTRSSARQALDAVVAYMANGSNLTAASYSIAGRTLARYALAELISLKSHLQAEVSREEVAQRAAAGLPDKRRIYVRFGP